MSRHYIVESFHFIFGCLNIFSLNIRYQANNMKYFQRPARASRFRLTFGLRF